MRRKIYLVLLIVCGIFSRGINIEIDENNASGSSKLLIRRKRVFNEIDTESRPTTIESTPYLINIVINSNRRCAGTLLAADIFITAAHCCSVPNATYSMLSGSSSVYRGRLHNVEALIRHPHFDLQNLFHDLVLVRFSPPIDFHSSPNRPIKLFNGHLAPNTSGSITSWGCIGYNGRRKTFPTLLNSISVPIISLERCQQAYHNIDVITDFSICTYYPYRLKGCDEGDSGAPLIVNHRLVGVMSWSGEDHHPSLPDVFANLLNPHYRNWIHSHVPNAL